MVDRIVLRTVIGFVIVLLTIEIANAGGNIWGSDEQGNDKYWFKPGESVYVTWILNDPDGIGDFYVVYNKEWKTGMKITDIVIKKENVNVNLTPIPGTNLYYGTLFLAVVGKGEGQIPYPGEYDIIYDANQNGIYEYGIDSVDYITCAGFETEVPEFNTIAVPIFIILVIATIIFSRK